MSDKLYDWLKALVLKILPELGTAYFAIAKIWGLPYGEEVVSTILAVTAFLGIIVSVAASIYNKKLEDEDGKFTESDGSSE